MREIISFGLLAALGYFLYLAHGWELSVAITLLLLGAVGVSYRQDVTEGRLNALDRKLDKLMESQEHQRNMLYDKLDSLSSKLSRIEAPRTNYNEYDYDD